MRYDDIINLPHHVSDKRPRMSMHDRAAQFSPFAALTGFDDAVRETARVTDSKPELDQDALALLDVRLALIKSRLSLAPEVEITYFKKDPKKAGGAAEVKRGAVRRIDAFERRLVMEDGGVIPLDDILALEGEVFSGAEES